jgi:hypothetical protein
MGAALCEASSEYQLERRLSGEALNKLLDLAATSPPNGRNQWTHQLLADKLMELGVVESVTGEMVRKALKEARSPKTMVTP